MEVQIVPAEGNEPIDRIHVVSITIRTFKGRRDVEAHLFKSCPEPSETADYPWDKLIGAPLDPENPGAAEGVKRMVAEAFTPQERDIVVEYLQERYGSRLTCITACPLSLPVPQGVTALSDIPEGKTLGFIHFENVQNYSLPFGIKGFYDLAQHPPLAADNS
ncbi:hypothetical protein [Oleidesulfovibrio sp.]|uniref:hypothetical protein n=1 Tax=Oleidesulfovibrio sp. TaxID=2909707 RepID=UPI003A854826